MLLNKRNFRKQKNGGIIFDGIFFQLYSLKIPFTAN